MCKIRVLEMWGGGRIMEQRSTGTWEISTGASVNHVTYMQIRQSGCYNHY